MKQLLSLLVLITLFSFKVNASLVITDDQSSTMGWQSPKYADSGVISPTNFGATLLYAPKWKGGSSIWPAYENHVLTKNWSQYDRLIIPIYFDSDLTTKHNLSIFISDSKHPIRKGAYFQHQLLPIQTQMIVVKIGQEFKNKNIDIKDINTIRLFTQNPPSDFHLYVGPMQLLEKDEKIPAIPKQFEKQAKDKRKFITKKLDGTLGWQSPKYADTGVVYPAENGLALLYAPKWKGGSFVWPAYDNSYFNHDWSEYDRLAVPVFYDSESSLKHALEVFITDSQHPLRKGAFFRNDLLPIKAQMIIFPIRKKFKDKNINAADITKIRFFSQNPPNEFRLYVGKMIFLKPNDPVPNIPMEIINLEKNRRGKLLNNIYSKMENTITKQNIQNLPIQYQKFYDTKKNNFLKQLHSGKIDDIVLMNGTNTIDYQSILSLGSFLKEQNLKNIKNEDTNILIGYAPSTLKILPKVPIFNPLPQKLQINVAKNENESFQLVVLPINNDCQNVEITFSDFTGTSGTLKSSTLKAIPVGFVETKFIPASGSRHIGFWPDPLLTYLSKIDIKATEAQSFWIKAEISKEAIAGSFNGLINILINGKVVSTIPLSLRIYNFSLPSYSLLPLAVTFGPTLLDESKNHFDIKQWQKHQDKWHEMLDNYYLHFDSLYWGKPSYNSLLFLKKLKEQGKKFKFNLGNFNLRDPKFAGNDEKNNYGMQKTIDRIRETYANAKQLGILDNAYIYGADEVKADNFYRVNRAASILKKEFPNIKILTTATDASYGTNGAIPAMDSFCALTSNYNCTMAEKARKTGKKVWWYISMDPYAPYANNFIESNGIEIRLLMGAMTAKYRPDGFLYYQISLWNSLKPMTDGPYTNWDARSYIGFNGDGNWCYPGPDFTPIATTRLENFRDGLEDYAYVKILENQLIKAKKNKLDLSWQKKAEKALIVPKSLVDNLKNYSLDNEKLQFWRHTLANLIETAPCE